MFGLQPTHLILILIIALVIFGPQRLPELGKSLGRAISEFKNATMSESPAEPKAAAPRENQDNSAGDSKTG